MDDTDASAAPGKARRELDWMRSGERAWLRGYWDTLTGLTEELELGPRDTQILKLRWLAEAEHYDDLWRRQRRMHDVLGVVTIVAGLAAPVLVAVNAPDWALALAGFVVAASSSLVGFFRYGERWRHQRKTAMLLKAEGVRFLELRSPYDAHGSHRNAFPHFIENLERINEAQSEEYLSLLSLGAPSRGEQSEELPGVTPASSDR